MKVGKGWCNGTFGEIVQGVRAERPFLITLPISNLKSSAFFIPEPNINEIICNSQKPKAIDACRKLFASFGLNGGGHLQLTSNIPIGKGMASSSADIIASMRAVADAYSLTLTEEIISKIASEIEPTDGVMYNGVVAYDYINGYLISHFGDLPSYIIIGIDVGGIVNTIEFNKLSKTYTSNEIKVLHEAYSLVERGIRTNKLSDIFKAATHSARINQKFLPKPYYNELEKLADDYQGGVVIAHSGTVMGILLDPSNTDIGRSVRAIVKEMSLKWDCQIKSFYFLNSST